jgi:hypothetical protein
MGEECGTHAARNSYRLLVRKRKGDLLEYLGVDGRMLLKMGLKK